MDESSFMVIFLCPLARLHRKLIEMLTETNPRAAKMAPKSTPPAYVANANREGNYISLAGFFPHSAGELLNVKKHLIR